MKRSSDRKPNPGEKPTTLAGTSATPANDGPPREAEQEAARAQFVAFLCSLYRTWERSELDGKRIDPPDERSEAAREDDGESGQTRR